MKLKDQELPHIASVQVKTVQQNRATIQDREIKDSLKRYKKSPPERVYKAGGWWMRVMVSLWDVVSQLSSYLKILRISQKDANSVNLNLGTLVTYYC